MKLWRRTFVLVAAVAALVAPAVLVNYAAAQAGTVEPEQLPNSRLGYAGFQRDTDEFREIDPARVMYPSACAPATVADQYSDPTAHRGREYDVGGYDAFGTVGPAGVVGVDVYAYESSADAATAFDALRALFTTDCPLDHDAIAWEFLRESPIPGTGSPYAPQESFTATAGNDNLGSRVSVTFASKNNYIVATGYRVESAAPTPETSADIADRAARAALETLVEHNG